VQVVNLGQSPVYWGWWVKKLLR